LAALYRFTRATVHHRGWAPETELRALLDAGFDRRHVLEVVLGVGMKMLSNYTNHLAGHPARRGLRPPCAVESRGLDLTAREAVPAMQEEGGQR